MRIAILGWGSLIWDKRNLKIDKIVGDSQYQGWYNTGPSLPIEFARISDDGRLTLVIKEGVQSVTTLYSISMCKDLDIAILNLATREGSCTNKIGYYLKQGNKVYPEDFPYKNILQIWIEQCNNIDAIVWTNLSIRFHDKTHQEFNDNNVIAYLSGLPIEKRGKAEEYIRKTPVQIQTPIRTAIERSELRWTPIE